MKNTYNFLAFDIGATSGRTILGTIINDKLELKELTRFPNNIIHLHNKLYWNIYSLFEELLNGIRSASDLGVKIDSIGIDTWGVDFVYLANDGSLIGLPRCYRDPYTENVPEEFFKLVSKEQLYKSTGIQIMDFNSLFQLYAAKKENSFALSNSERILFIPDALSYLLTGNKVCEYTIASTAQLLNPSTKQVATDIYESLEIPQLLADIIMPGSEIGILDDDIKYRCNLKTNVPVIAVAGHDTASAVVSVPASDQRFAYISSGTWSLMGIEVNEPIVSAESFEHNFTNEGGVEGTIRFLKNIAGMWLLEECRREWSAIGKDYEYSEIVKMACDTPAFQFVIDPDDAVFTKPVSMIGEIQSYCAKSNQTIPRTDAQLIRCIFDSLAFKYRFVFDKLQSMAPFKIEKLYVIGGGSRNALLNQITANALNIPVIAGPGEATAIGNIMVQAIGVGLINTLSDARAIIRNSVDLEEFAPQDTEMWESNYKKFLKTINQSH